MRGVRIPLLLLAIAAAESDALAQASTVGPRVDLAAALSPGARVRVRQGLVSATRVGMVTRRSGDTLTIFTADFGVLIKDSIVVRIGEARRLDVSAGLKPPSNVGIATHMLLGAACGAIVTHAFWGMRPPSNILFSRSAAAALLFAIAAPRPTPEERWLPVRSSGTR